MAKTTFRWSSRTGAESRQEEGCEVAASAARQALQKYQIENVNREADPRFILSGMELAATKQSTVYQAIRDRASEKQNDGRNEIIKRIQSAAKRALGQQPPEKLIWKSI